MTATQTSKGVPKRDKRKDFQTPTPTNKAEEGLSEIVQNAVSNIGQSAENFFTKLGSICLEGGEPEVNTEIMLEKTEEGSPE